MSGERDPWPCSDCGELMVGRGIYKRLTDRSQYRAHGGYGRCSMCFARARRQDLKTGPGWHERQAIQIAELVEDISWIVGTDSPENIAHRVGYSNTNALARRLERNGHPDLARIFDRREMAS